MKRHPALRDLSDNHHRALVQAHRLKNVESQTAQAVGEEFLKFWREHAALHFREEEEALLPFFARWGDAGSAEIREMQRQHVLIRRDAGLLEKTSDFGVEFLRALGQQLETHVRLEEREIFPLVEQTVPAANLDELGQILALWRGQRGEK